MHSNCIFPPLLNSEKEKNSMRLTSGANRIPTLPAGNTHVNLLPILGRFKSFDASLPLGVSWRHLLAISENSAISYPGREGNIFPTVQYIGSNPERLQRLFAIGFSAFLRVWQNVWACGGGKHAILPDEIRFLILPSHTHTQFEHFLSGSQWFWKMALMHF